jgi:hypothetical protein
MRRGCKTDCCGDAVGRGHPPCSGSSEQSQDFAGSGWRNQIVLTLTVKDSGSARQPGLWFALSVSLEVKLSCA